MSTERTIAGEHVGGCNPLCDDEGHYLLPSWETTAERLSWIAEADRHTSRARLAVREASAALTAPRPAPTEARQSAGGGERHE